MDRKISIIKWCGYTGLIPVFMTLVGFYAAPNHNDLYLAALIAYSAVILSFVGAVHWGFILSDVNTDGISILLAIATLPSLLAWTALLFPPLPALALLIICFAVLYTYERFSVLSKILPGWYLQLQKQLTLLITIMQITAVAGLY